MDRRYSINAQSFTFRQRRKHKLIGYKDDEISEILSPQRDLELLPPLPQQELERTIINRWAKEIHDSTEISECGL